MRRILVLVVLLFAAGSSEAQTERKIEDSVLFYLDKVQKHGNYFGDMQQDSLILYNACLQNYLQTILSKQPLSLLAKFSRLIDTGMTIVSSKDKKFRVYSWDMQDGGTMHFFNSVAQFQTEKGVQTAMLYIDTFVDGEAPRAGFFYPKIYSIVSKNGKTFYLAIRKGIYSSAAHSVGIQCFAIENGLIDDSIKIFKTKNDYLNNIDVSVDYTELKKMTKEPDIYFSSDNTKMYVPLIDNDRYQGKYLVYKFDGNNYVFDKNAK